MLKYQEAIASQFEALPIKMVGKLEAKFKTVNWTIESWFDSLLERMKAQMEKQNGAIIQLQNHVDTVLSQKSQTGQTTPNNILPSPVTMASKQQFAMRGVSDAPKWVRKGQ